MRLDKFISNFTAYSRTEAKKLIRSGRVRVNNAPTAIYDSKIQASDDLITLDGKVIAVTPDIYIMLNKPAGYVCANKDSEHPTVFDLLKHPDNYVAGVVESLPIKTLQVVGRLDKDTTGMVLITNDGQWNHKITSPNTKCKKVYRVSLDAPIAPHIPELFAKGIQLEGEQKKTLPALVEVITPQSVRLSISEGRYHQVKRMFAATGNHVNKLHREAIAGIKLDKDLNSGQFRKLNPAELSTISSNTKQYTT